MKEQLFRFLVTRNIILPPNMVSGNFSQRTVTAVSSLVEKTIIAGYEDNKSVALIMSELSKAFDIISDLLWHLNWNAKILWHPQNCFENFWVLPVKENAAGFNWVSKFWFQACLARCAHRTIYISMGVPQWSILGPILFLVAINGINRFLDDSTLLSADDTTLGASSKGEITIVAEDQGLGLAWVSETLVLTSTSSR